MLGVAIRIAQRMGIHDESANAKCTAFEAEMRRRLWWSLVLFDNRMGETSNNKTSMMAPTWDCRPPVNVSDFDLRPDMKSLPASDERPTEALFAVVRSQLGDYIRHSACHLEFANPSLRAIIKDNLLHSVSESGGLDALEKRLEDHYLKVCNPDNPIHFMTVWTTRSYIAKHHLLEYYSKESKTPEQPTTAQRNKVISFALRMLECDTRLMTSHLTKGFVWLIQDYFPMPAYMNIVVELKERPVEKNADRIWDAMNENYNARFVNIAQDGTLIWTVMSRLVLQAWECREAALKRLDRVQEPPQIVTAIKHNMKEKQTITQPNEQHAVTTDSIDTNSMSMPMIYGGQSSSFDVAGLGSIDTAPPGYANLSGPPVMDITMNQLGWSPMDWNSMYARGW